MAAPRRHPLTAAPMRRTLLLAILVALTVMSPVVAHDIPRETIMSAFVKVTGRELHFVLRVPLEILQGVPFPLNGNVIDLPNAEPATRQALEGLTRSITIWEDGTELRPV